MVRKAIQNLPERLTRGSVSGNPRVDHSNPSFNRSMTRCIRSANISLAATPVRVNRWPAGRHLDGSHWIIRQATMRLENWQRSFTCSVHYLYQRTHMHCAPVRVCRRLINVRWISICAHYKHTRRASNYEYGGVQKLTFRASGWHPAPFSHYLLWPD